MLLSIIIPCRDEADSILETVNYITEELNNINHELILINDFSKDSTLNILEDISKSKSNIYAYNNNIKGLGGAIEIGIKKSNGKYTAIMMADLSDNVSDLKNYIEIARKDESLMRYLGQD